MQVITKKELDGFYGTENYYKHWTGYFNYTDGVRFLEVSGAAWLIDLIASYNRKEPFQVWKLHVKDNKGIVTMQEDKDTPILVKQETFTDFCLPSIELWLIDGVLILPSEY